MNADIRKMLFDFALEQARKVCATVDSSDLDFGRIQETLPVLHHDTDPAVEWHIVVRYWTEDDVLRIEGHPHAPPPDEVNEMMSNMPPGFQQILGQALGLEIEGVVTASGVSASDCFTFVLPRAWLPDRQT